MNNNNNFNESAGQPEHKKITATRILLLVVCLAVVGVAGITLQTRRSKNQPTVEQPSGRRFAGKAENSVPFVPATRQSKDAQYLSKSQINADGTITGAKIVMDEGIQRTVREIMRDQASAPRRPERVMPEHEIERGVKAERPGAPATSQWPVPKAGDQPQVQPQAPQTTGLSFDGATLSDTGAFPPDSMGAVGPTQYFTFVNGRLRTFSKTGTADGVINADPDVFFASVMTPVTPPVVLNFTSDPNVRYDRFTSRWFLTIIDVPCTNATCTTTAANRVLIAVSDAASNGTISAGTVWTFFQFVGDPGTNFLDYPSLGVDVNALYIGGNMFSSAGAFVGCNGYVVQKSSILGGGPGVATAFANIAAGAGAGPESPRGVDNFDSTATEGYIVGPDNASFSTITFRRVSNPGSATPTISANIFVTVPTTTSPNTVEHLGNTGGANGNLDTIDDRFFQAMIRNGRLWSAHNFRVSSAGVASTVAAARNGVRWYEFQGLTSTPTLVQSGTVFDNAATRAAARQYTIPSVTVSGQGHAVLGFTMAGSPVGATPAYVGRLASDTLGTMAGPPTIAAVAFGTTTANYNPASDPGGASGRRWGDYSHTSLDPKDDMTIWTIQEYNQASNSYAVRVGKLLAPPPATLSTLAPSSVSAGQASVNVTITGTSTAGSGFYDPGANLPAPALPFTHIAAAVTGGVTVNSVTYTDPTHITLNLSTVGASAGAQNVTVTNPDGQSTVGNGILTVTGGNTAPSITPVAVNRQQGSPSSNSTIATVSDTETAAGSLTVNVNGSASATVNNITVSNLVNNSGTITANVVAACNATLGTTNFTINVSDGSLTTPGTLMVTVSANTAPTLTYNNQAVLFGNALTVNPASGPSDNGSVASIVLQSVTPSTAPGTITVNNTTGAVSVPNNVPIGGYTVTIRATDNCNAPTDAPFTLTVNNNLPTITAGGPLARQQGSAGTVSTVATVGDTETAAGSLTVTATTVPAGLTVTGITNTSGTITANVAAACNAALGTNTVVLTVTDGNGGTATANLTVNVTANTAPVLTYSAQAVAAGGALNISPATGPSDNGAVSTITVQSQGAYTGTISVNNSTGVVSLSNAKPGGVHTITIRATDNCNTTTDATFTLTVNCPTISLSPASLPNGTVGIGYNQTITASGGTAPYSFSISAGVLPTGLTLSSAGVLSGTPSVANPFNFTVLATDANGCTGTLAYAVTINPANILPTINAVAVSRQQGSPVSNSTIANVNDPDQALNTLAVTVNSGASATVNGVTVNGLSVNAAGVVTANVMAACGATNASFTLTVTDAASATATATLTVTVTANTAPTLSYANQALAAGSALNISPASGPSDNGSVSTITVLNQGTYTGTISVNNGTGVVSLSNAAPVGVHTITIRATDNCGATTDAPFTLTVNNNLPTITAAAPLARQQGGAGIVSTVATVSDTETPAGSLTVTATTVPAGLTVTGITNTSGTITANVAASCAATLGANTVVLTVTDGNGGTATANLTVNVTANTAPVLTYSAQAVAAGGALNISPATGPSDNGSVSTITVQSQGTYTGTISVNNSTGVVSLSNAKPGGVHTITIRATDNCNSTTDATFTLTVNCPAISLSPASLPNGTVGTGYNQTITASGGTAPYSFSAIAGVLPTGLALSAGGVLSGTPSAANAFNFTVQATDANGCTGILAYAMTINTANTLPTITAVAVSRQQGSPGANATIANVNDPDQALNSLNVTVNSGASVTVNGVTVSGLSVNAAGVVTANVIATCGATNASFMLTVTDAASATATATLTVTVTANTAPTLSYANQALFFGAALNVTPASGPSDNGTVSTIVVLTQGTYTGTISVNNGTGVVSLSNAAPVGVHTITIRATDNCGATTDAPFTLTVNNNLPTITAAAPLARQQGSAGTVSTVATVSDTETAAGSLTVAATTVPAGLTVTGITNTSGTITANVAASCAATLGANTVVLTVTDGNGGTTTANLTVNVTANTAPVLTYSAQAVAAGGALNISPASGPSDNGSVSTITVQSQGAYTGTISVNNSTGIVSISNAKPDGTHTITIRATDNCGATTDATLTLTVVCPTISLSPTTLPNGAVGMSYNQTLTASGGTAPYSFSTIAGVLPTGLSLSAGGVLSGTPSAANTFSFTVRATDANGCTGSRAYTVTMRRRQVWADFDGDGRSDLSVWRPSTGNWQWLNSSTNSLQTQQWGAGYAPYNDVIVPGDYDGDGKIDQAIWRGADSIWYIRKSSDGGFILDLWGTSNAPYFDIPVPGDYDGDGKTDLAVWRRDGTWFVKRSSDGSFLIQAHGQNGDIPVPADYDGDGKTDLAVFRPGAIAPTPNWIILNSSTNTITSIQWGAGYAPYFDTPVPADYDGDGKADLAIWRGADSIWYIRPSANPGNPILELWGANYAPYFDIPTPGDFDGDGKADIAVWRRDGTWFVKRSTNGSFLIQGLGQTGDVPVPGAPR